MTGIRQTVSTLVRTLIAVAGWATAPATVAEDRWIEGQHYQTLTPPVAVGRGSDVVVTEFFWYGCGHCYTFEPMLTAWASSCPKVRWCNPRQPYGTTPCACTPRLTTSQKCSA